MTIVAVVYSSGGSWLDSDRWFAPASIVLGGLAGASLPTLRRVAPAPGVGAATLLAALGATYLCVPETDQFWLAVWLPGGVLVAEVVARRQLGIEWYGAAAVPIVWAGLWGAQGRFSALAGCLFAWWAVIHLPIVTMFRPVETGSARAYSIVLVGVSAAVVGVRTGGVEPREAASIARLGLTAGGSFAVSMAILGRRRT